MPSFTFQGFSSGSQVALSAAQGAINASESVSAWGQGTVASLSIVARRSTSLVAPASVYFEAIELSGFSVPGGPGPGEVYDPSFHEITYIWTVRDAPLSFTNALNLPDSWKNANTYYGKEVAIAFNDAGTYHIDLWAVDRDGNTGIASYQVVVADADSVYSGTNTICYSTSDFVGAPAGADQVGSLTALNNALAAKGSSADVRILFRGGQTFDLGASIASNSVRSSAFGSFGSGGRATVKLLPDLGDGSPYLFSAPLLEFKLYDLNLKGDWDASKEHGVVGNLPITPECAIDKLYHRVTFDGCSLISTCRLAGSTLFVMSDSHITNWRAAGLYLTFDEGGTKYHGLVGTSIRQHVDAKQGGSTIWGNTLGPLRAESVKHLTVSACDFFTRNGWSGGAVLTADQPCLRLNSQGYPDVFVNLDRVVCEGGYQVIRMRGEDSNIQEVPGNYVFDKLLTIGSPETEVHIDCAFGGVTLRNRYGFEPNVPKLSYGALAFERFDIDNGQEQTINQNAPVSIYNCTYLSLLTAENMNAQNGGILDVTPVIHSGDFSNYTYENNLAYAPNQGTPDTATPLDVTTTMSGLVLNFKGRHESLPSVEQSSPGVAHGDTMLIGYGDLPDKDGNPTNQSYWNSVALAGDDKHMMYDREAYKRHYAELGHFSVSPGPTGLTITNTSGAAWSFGSILEYKLDHSSQGPTLDTTYDARGEIVPDAMPLSPQLTSAGFVAQDDFFALARPGSDIAGAPSGQPSRGAIDNV